MPVNSLFYQIQLGDPASVLALVNVITGIAAAVVCALFARRWRHEVSRVALVLWMMFLAAWTAVAYGIILYVDPSVNVALLRWVLSGWHIAAAGVCLLFHLIQTHDPGEIASQEITRLKHECVNCEQTLILQKGVIAHYQKSSARLEAALDQLNESYSGQNELVLNLRQTLTKMVEEQMKLKEELLRLEWERERDG